MTRAPDRRARATAYVLLAAVLWSSGGLGVKSVTAAPLSLAGYRSLFAIPVLVLAAAVEARRSGTRVAATLRRPYVWAAAASYAVMMISFVVSAKLTTAANAILLQYTGPIYVALLSWPLLRERVRPIDWIATAGCVLGMTLFFLDRVSAQGRLGNLVAVVSSLGFAGVPLLMRMEQRAQGPAWRGEAASPFIAMAVGNVMAVLFCGRAMLSGPVHGSSAWVIVVLLGAVQIGAAYWFYGAAVGRLPAIRSTLLATIEPILNPVWVVLVNGERPSTYAVAGGAVILASVTASALVRAERASRAEDSPR